MRNFPGHFCTGLLARQECFCAQCCIDNMRKSPPRAPDLCLLMLDPETCDTHDSSIEIVANLFLGVDRSGREMKVRANASYI
jgi:hypothetical protein